MSIKALIAALLILGGLAGAALFLPRLIGNSGAAPAGSAGSALLLAINPASLDSIELQLNDQVVSRAQRTPAGGWVIFDGQQRRWPGVLPSDVSQALAALSMIEAQDGLSFRLPQGALVFELYSGDVIKLEFAQASLGGRRMIRSGTNLAVVEERILRPLLDPGPLSWRSRAAAPAARRASRIELVQQDDSIELAKLGGHWRLRQPLSARADERAVNALFDALSALRVKEFLDDEAPDPSSAGLNPPRLIIAYETDRRRTGAASEGRIKTVRQELHIGGPASASGQMLYARATGHNSAWMLVNAAGIASISTAARNYIEPTITGVLPSNVFWLTLRRSQGGDEDVYRRSVAGWINEQTGEPVSAALDRLIRETLEFLTSQPGEPEVSADASDLTPQVEIELGDLDGDPIEIISAGYTADGILGFRSQHLLMLFDDAPAPELLGMSNGSP